MMGAKTRLLTALIRIYPRHLLSMSRASRALWPIFTS